MMLLIDAVRDMDSLDDEWTIYAAEPWTASSNAIVAPEPEAGGLPPEAQTLGLKYFLEVFVAREFLEGWKSNMASAPPLELQCARLIQYATTDA